MPSAAALELDHLTPEMSALLWRGARDNYGYICRPSEVREFHPTLSAAERLGYLRFIDVTRPWITAEGRRAIGAPTEIESDREKWRRACAVNVERRPPDPKKRDDPRSDFDYRSYHSMKYVCVLAVRLPGARNNPQSVKVGRVTGGDPVFLSDNNSILMPESEGRFVLALIPEWLQERTRLPMWAAPLREDEAWTAGERETWTRLAGVCSTINARIRRAGQRAKVSMPFGYTA